MTIAAARPVIRPEAYGDRIARARGAMAEQGVTALLIGVGADLRYLTGYPATPLERLTMLVLARTGEPILIAPRLEAMAAEGCPAAVGGAVTVVPWDETDDPHDVVAAHLARSGGWTDGERVLVSGDLWAMHILALQRVLPGAGFGLATDVLRGLRVRKAQDEVELLRAAAHGADRVIDAIAAGPIVGRTEIDIAREIRDRLEDEEHDAPSFAIVGSGPNSASPHHHPTDRVIQAGEALVLDIGGIRHGYSSDTTRTLWVTGSDPVHEPDAEFLRIYDLVRQANASATAAVRPGTSCEAIDAEARSVIAEAGYGEAFLHRTGHGIGVEVHEEPYIVKGNAEALEPGMAFSIEPGIYLAGRYGVRIEDIVVCGEAGADVLNVSSRDLRVVAG
jgi:Xaa-Pro aminopeptidase